MDRKEVVKELGNVANAIVDGYICEPDQAVNTIAEAIALLKKQPEIIRCKDCRHWIPGRITGNDDFVQPRCKRNGGGWSADEFCSNAERG